MGEKHRHCHVYSKKVYERIKLPSQLNKLYIYMYRQLYTHKQRSEFSGASVGLVSNHALHVYLLQQFIHSRNPFSWYIIHYVAVDPTNDVVVALKQLWNNLLRNVVVCSCFKKDHLSSCGSQSFSSFPLKNSI
jgi:hypothetical protein